MLQGNNAYSLYKMSVYEGRVNTHKLLLPYDQCGRHLFSSVWDLEEIRKKDGKPATTLNELLGAANGPLLLATSHNRKLLWQSNPAKTYPVQ